MKKFIFKLLIILFLLPLCNSAHAAISLIDNPGRYTKEKKITKKFNVSKTASLKVDNSYGNIEISTWNKDVIHIEVIIKTNGNDEALVTERLEEINIEFQNTLNLVSAKTHFERESNSWWEKLFGNFHNVNIDVNYIIRAPITNNVNLNNDYGNIYIDKLEGDSKINCDYGSLNIGELLGNSNVLNLDYSRNSQIEYIKRGIVNSDYSDINIGEAISLDVKADYTNTAVRKVELFKFNCDYGSLKVGKVKKIVGTGDYVSTKIGEVHQSMEVGFDYGNAEIEKIVKGASNIKASSNYTNLKIGYASDYAFNFAVKTSYGNVKGLENFTYNKGDNDSTNKSFVGYHLDNKGTGSVKINTNYGNVSFIAK